MLPGIPGVADGRTKNFGWAMTIGLADSTDLWEEELNADRTQYKVDGEWRNLTKITTEIPIAGKNSTYHETFLTHRGTLVSWGTMGRFKDTRRLKNKYYSLGWTMMAPGELCFEFLF